jgi:sugar phosphate isomerase/epimerase
MMRFGTGTWSYNSLTVMAALEKIAGAGFSVAEIWMEHLLATKEDAKDIYTAARSLGIELTLHATSYDINPISENRGIASESIRQAYLALELARDLEAHVLVMHPGRVSSTKGQIPLYRKRQYELLDALDQKAGEYGLQIALEVMEKRPKEILIYPEEVDDLMSQGYRNIGLTIDIAHASTVMDPVEFIDSIKEEWIHHIHISDGSAKHTHLPLGEGTLPLERVLSRLCEFYEQAVVIEGYDPKRAEEITRANYHYLASRGYL